MVKGVLASAVLALAGLDAGAGVLAPDPAAGPDGRVEACGDAGAKLVPSDVSTGLRFGYSVALDGDTLIVGAEDVARLSRGVAYVFVRDATGWTEQARLEASDGAELARFGVAVAVSGDRVAVGASTDSDHGAVYVFARSGGVWTEEAKLIASDIALMDGFGTSVALEGDTLLVGASSHDDATLGSNAGAAYVFSRASGSWVEGAKLLAPDGESGFRFGAKVALEGDTAVVSTPADDETGTADGAAWVFTLVAGTWSPQDKLTTSPGSAEMGIAGVAISGDTVILSEASFYTSVGEAVHVFVRSSEVWSEEAVLRPPDRRFTFGTDADIEGDTIVVGDGGNDSGGPDSGAVHVYERAGGIWTWRSTLFPWGGGDGQALGKRLSLSGGSIAAGADRDAETVFSGGAVYVFDGCSGPCEPAALLPIAELKAVKDSSGVDLVLSWRPDGAASGTDLWWVAAKADVPLASAAGEPSPASAVGGCRPAGGTSCVDGGAVTGAPGAIRYYNAVAACEDGSEGPP